VARSVLSDVECLEALPCVALLSLPYWMLFEKLRPNKKQRESALAFTLALVPTSVSLPSNRCHPPSGRCSTARNQSDGLKFLSRLPDAITSLVIFDPEYRGIMDYQAYGNEVNARSTCALAQMTEIISALLSLKLLAH